MSTPNICRRCKKKRSPDETEETLKYRTCKPCREIERKKKRLKKLQKLGQTEAGVADAAAAAAATAAVAVDNAAQHINVPDLRQQDALNAKIINIANQASLQSQQQTYERQPEHRPEDHHQQQYHQQYHQVAPQQAKIDDKEIPIDESLLKEGQSEDHGLQPKDEHHQHHQHVQVQDQGQVEGQEHHQHQGQVQVEGHEHQGQEHQQQYQGIPSGAEHDGGEDKNAATDFSNDTKNIFAAIQNASLVHSENKDPNADYCLYCGALRDVNDNGRYKLCGNCVDNPLDSNVFSDFGEYLTRIDTGKYSDLKNLILLKKFEPNDTIPDLQINSSDDQSSNNLNEIMQTLNHQFINPVISTSGFKFSKGSSNLSTKPYPKAIKVLYKCKQDIKTTQRSNNNNINGNSNSNNNINQTSIDDINSPSNNHVQLDINDQSSNGNLHESEAGSGVGSISGIQRKMKTEYCDSNLYISYDVISKSLNIKYSHNTHKTYLEKLYSQDLINTVKGYLETDPDFESIFDKLSTPDYSNPHLEQIRGELLTLKKSNFVRDFANLL
ncbi:hypothetical protein BN7_6402 [Wickerhamomyces ciferrii]|uniref:Uncharacterized protein n=1 Tax=Wickerhamomyces ciferrii (strain ATCC 14091 / BCRC 22168 / CBS 111 / JCM 3599 / NBRC 0793 / NRRL Y-1031 F-60-10) TaxID=1206466 RepID=K0L077_WICCF|nr:uncharacterized protein BN7_6402 [Wickerhamomyces ciferrii]CCH46803.1 hypothetical protein BN7_6402 [Wickerhamomyces ciferrii]